MHLLLVEDDYWVANFIQRGLTLERIGVDLSTDGESAIEKSLHRTYDVIILDVMLPIVDGFEVCRHLRQQGVQTPILMLTAKDDVDEKVRGLELGADDYLTKPFEFKELLARLQALGRRRRALDLVAVIQVADLILDKIAREVRRDDESIPLTPREFAILEYLMENVGRALSREMIEKQVFGSPNDAGTNLVDVYIRRLRQKIDQGYSPALLHTVRGVGYMLKTS
jgi:two-component system copper resistance phosphate regulon response regulator CusR